MIENEQVYVSYVADGVQREWEFPHSFVNPEDVALYIKHEGEMTKIASSQYTFDEETNKVTYPKDSAADAVPSGDYVLVCRETPISQEEDSSNTNFKSNDIERIADKLTMIEQELADKLSRAIAYDPVQYHEVGTNAKDYIDLMAQYRDSAAASSADATNSKTQAAASASSAATSAQNAAASETAAANSAVAAAASEQHTIQNEELLQEYVDQAEDSANTAVANANQAVSSATSASASATAAATSAQNAATSETHAANSATAAASSATTASSYSSTAQSAASTATEKANAASTSATAAAASAISAGTSADNAAASALVASTSATAAQDVLAEVQSYKRIDRTYIAGTAIDDYTGSLTVFDLGLDFDLADYVVDVFVNGKGYQGVKSPVDFTVSGDVVTFVEAVPVGAVVQFRINASTTVIIAGSVDVDAKIAEHNTSTTAHSDIRTALTTHTGNTNIHVTSSDKSNWNAKQAALSTDQIAATNSGVTASKVSSYDTHVADTDIHVTVSDKSTWNGKQSALSTTQLSATNSGITSAKVSGYDTHVANGDIHVTSAQKTTWTGKQDAISDLATIRSGAAKGNTAVQKSGDTMTGDLTLSNTNFVIFKDADGDGYGIRSVKYNGRTQLRIYKYSGTDSGSGMYLDGSSGNKPYYYDGQGHAARLLNTNDVTSSYSASGTSPVNGTAVAAAIANKADTDLSNVTKPHVTETYSNGTSWYRVYSDGWCEQGGYVDNIPVNSFRTVSLLKAYTNTNYSIQAMGTNPSGFDVPDTFLGTRAINTSSFEMGIRYYTNGTAYAGRGFYWEAKGYIS